MAINPVGIAAVIKHTVNTRLTRMNFFIQAALGLGNRHEAFFASFHTAATLGKNVAMPSRRLRLCGGCHRSP